LSAFVLPSQCLANAFSSLCVLLLTPSSVFIYTHRALPRLLLYYELVRLPYRHTSALPLQLVGSLFGERYGSPKFRRNPLDHLPWTQTPTRHCILTISVYSSTGFEEMKPLALCNKGNFGAQYLHLRYGRLSAILMASHNLLPPYTQRSVLTWWLAFDQAGLSS
jgi:hypothetical protein